MIKKIIISTCLLLSLVSFAQEGTSSPYSFYGIGDIRFKGTLENRSMAGVGVEQDSIHLNLENPASYANLKLTTFSMGGTYASKGLKSDSGTASTKRTTLDYLAVGLPLGKFGVGFGLVPYSSVGYKIESLGEAGSTETNKRFNGTGGLNKVFLGVGYKIKPNFSIGADMHYNFGKIETNSLEFITGVPVGTQEKNTADLSGMNFNIGAMYQTKIYKKLNLYSSLNYTVQANLNSENTRNIATVVFGSGTEPNTIDPYNVPMEMTKVKLPSKISFAAGIGESQKWLLGGKISYQKSSGQENSYNKADNVGYGKYGSVSIGGYYIPDYNSFSNYAKRVTYRGGLKYEKTGLVINSESINDMGLTLGVGLPMSGSLSNINLGFELGKRGTTDANLVQENYANFSVSFSFNDKWFVKNKFH
jgi:long-subunit fatty acid transport protein